MNYPLISEYIEAIKAAEENFEELKNLRPVLDEDGEPVMTSGNFAVVFKMKNEQTGKLHAVKCFLKEQEGRAEAYRMIAEELEYVNSTFLTPIKYLDKELFVDSKNSDETEFPVLLMDWVEGQTLDKYIREHIYDQYELSLLAYQFSRLAMWLQPQPFAHGDLKPDNILVKDDGTLVLVDYDGMYVPAMKGQKARELGSPDFRHPSRTEDDFDEHIDDFSLASILLSLKVISLQSDLLGEFGASDRLLFSEKDYRNIIQCELLKKVFPSNNTELNIVYSIFLLAHSNVVLTKDNLAVLNVLEDNLYKKAESFCHGTHTRTKNYWSGAWNEDDLPIEPDKNKAYILFNDLAKRGCVDAQCCMGCLLWGKNNNKSWIEAKQWYKLAIKNGCDRAIFHLKERADKHYQGNDVAQDYNKAFDLYKVIADAGDDYGIMMLVFSLENGLGTIVNEELAQKWSENIKDPQFIYQLGQKYFDGKEIEVNYKKAFFWFHKAALCDNKSAIMMLGYCYEKGLGTHINTTNAQYWYDKINDGHYAYTLGVKFFEGGIATDYKRAVEWFNKAIDMGEVSAYPYLAVCYSKGLGADFKDKHKSNDLFNKATSSGFNSLIGYCFCQSQYELCSSLLGIWMSKLQEEHPDDLEDWLDFWDAKEYQEQLERKGFNVYFSDNGDNNSAQMKQNNTNYPTNSIDINFPFSLDKGRMNENKDKYGIVKDRWGNYLIGTFTVDHKKLVFGGVKCGRNGVYSYCYGQLFEQMVQTDYPKVITKDVYDRTFSLLTNCITEIIDILNAQPQKKRQQTVNSKFFIMCDNEIELCNITHVFDGHTYYDGIHISWKDFPVLLFERSILGVEKTEEKYRSTFLDSNVYDKISQKIKDANNSVEMIIKTEYNK